MENVKTSHNQIKIDNYDTEILLTKKEFLDSISEVKGLLLIKKN